MQTVVVLCADVDLAHRYLADLRAAGSGCEVIPVWDFNEAKRTVACRAPAAILIDESALAQGALLPSSADGSLRKAALVLSRSAPVVVVASPDRQSELAGLIAAGIADFVSRVGTFAPLAVAMIERRLRQSELSAPAVLSPQTIADENFGEILRHEVNNPLTGILGNAELLLAELRRQNDERLPQSAQKRIQTIADLAIRLRETVRRLSNDLEERNVHAKVV